MKLCYASDAVPLLAQPALLLLAPTAYAFGRIRQGSGWMTTNVFYSAQESIINLVMKKISSVKQEATGGRFPAILIRVVFVFEAVVATSSRSHDAAAVSL